MAMDLVQQTLLWAFLIALVVGAIANKTNFCTMGAVSDCVNTGDSGRMRAWVFAIASAITAVALLETWGQVDLSLVEQGDTGKPPYTAPQFTWLRYILGGLLFGIGMTLGSGCGNKTLVRIGGGNLKSIFVFLVMGAGAYLMIYTDFGFYTFLQWMPTMDFTDYAIPSQGIDAILLHGLPLGVENPQNAKLIIALIIAVALFIWCFKSVDFYKSVDNIVGGTVIGIAVAAAWYITAGPHGQELLEEAPFLDQVPYDVGAQSLTFVKPSGHFYYWIREGFASQYLSFALVAASGIIIGSFIYAIFTKAFRIEWFASMKDFVNHFIGGLLMGIGGVLSLGCTFGQAISGASTLALGALLTFIFIVLGAATTMKVSYYKLLYGDEASFPKALLAALADLKLIPAKWRQLEAI
ncbi:MAG: YeeE/YedE family protein [Gammaproteobacteria bacterium]|nr:YeeE/YedE family protein [Gammaproteobacteria bacterium]